jgi:AcrR family transcriptional regulator
MSSDRLDDRTAKARIRDAAIACVARYGTAGTTVRKVASEAGVSPGLVIHHFGSMDGLRAACDEFVASTIRNTKLSFADQGVGFDLLGALRRKGTAALPAYLAEVLTEDSPAVAKLVDDLVSDAIGYMKRYEELGWVKPSATPEARAAIAVIWSLGALALHRHVKRLIGMDLADPQYGKDPAAIATYWIPAFELLSGVFSDEFSEQIQTMIGGLAQKADPQPQEGS